MELKTNLSNNLKALRAASTKSLEEFSAELGIGKTTLQDIESGNCNSTLETVELIADSLGLPPVSLFAETKLNEKLSLSRTVLEVSERFCRLSAADRKVAEAHFDTLIKLLSGDVHDCSPG